MIKNIINKVFPICQLKFSYRKEQVTVKMIKFDIPFDLSGSGYIFFM